MKLYTERKHYDYERRVDIFVNNSQNEIPSINDTETCKLVIVTVGTLAIELDGKEYSFNKHTVMFLSNRDNLCVSDRSKFKATTIFFKPTAINDILNYDDLYSGKYEDFDQVIGSTAYQDYRSVRNFIIKDGATLKYCELEDITYENIMDIILKMKYELNEQYDGYWPCRSRSYFLELLFILNSRCENDLHFLKDDSVLINKIIAYLNVHIDEKITLDTITTSFHINRNSLNKMFIDNYDMTCLAYLLKLRMDLSKMLLTETALPISEIGRRVGFTDQNYFARTFSKECGISPSNYRSAYTIATNQECM